MEEQKIKISIKNRFTGEILFEYEKVNNTIKETAEEAVKKGAYLRDAYLGGAYLRGADLRGADLRDADLGGADLRDADLGGADLRDAYLRGAYLRGADLRGADLRDAYLRGAKNIPYVTMSCPTDGAFVGWKKVHDDNLAGYYLVKLQIMDDSRRSSATGNKCRCDKARVLDISDIANGEHVNVVVNTYWHNTVYKIGEIVEADSWDEDRWNECSHGIHFFTNKQDAINY